MAKEYFKNLGSAVNNVAKSLLGIAPNLSLGISMFNDRVFRWDTTGYSAYNNKIFYTGANIIVRKMIEAPITFNRKKENATKSMSKFYSKTISNPERNTIKSGALDELPDHELAKMFTIETMEDFWHNYNYGSGFLFFEAGNPELTRNTKPTAIHSLRPDRITIVTNDGRFSNVAYYKYTTLNGETIDIQPEYILHLKHWNPNLDSNLKGYGLDLVCAKDIALNEAGNEAEGAAYVNGGRGTLLSSKAEVVSDGTGGGSVKTKMTKEQMSSIKEQVVKDMEGARNNRRITVTNGEVVVTPYGDTLAEMEINKSEDSRWKNIFAIMGIPWALTPVASQSSENSIVTGFKALVTNLIISEERKFDESLTRIIQKWWPGIVALHDLTEYAELAPDLALMAQIYGKPQVSVDETRKVFGHDEIGGEMGAAILVPSGLMMLSDLVSGELDVTESEVL